MKRGVKGINAVLSRELAEKATLLLTGICSGAYHIQITYQYRSNYLAKVYDLVNQTIDELEIDTEQLCYPEDELFIELDNYLVGSFAKAKMLFNPLLKELILESLYQVLSYKESLSKDGVIDRVERRLTRSFQGEIHYFSDAIEEWL